MHEERTSPKIVMALCKTLKFPILMASENNQFVFVRTNCMFVLLGQYILPFYKSFSSSYLHHLASLFYEAVHLASVSESIKHVASGSDLI